jgi:hypothetical protein
MGGGRVLPTFLLIATSQQADSLIGFGNRLGTFSNPDVGPFLEGWLKDAPSLEDSDEDVRLQRPTCRVGTKS